MTYDDWLAEPYEFPDQCPECRAADGAHLPKCRYEEEEEE
jgi:hypothetical protein